MVSLGVLKSIQTFPPCFILLSALFLVPFTCNSHLSRLQSTPIHLMVEPFKKCFLFRIFLNFIFAFVIASKQLTIEYDTFKGDRFSPATIDEISSSVVHNMSMSRRQFYPFWLFWIRHQIIFRDNKWNIAFYRHFIHCTFIFEQETGSPNQVPVSQVTSCFYIFKKSAYVQKVRFSSCALIKDTSFIWRILLLEEMH